MSSRSDDLNIRVGVTNDASAELRKVAKDVDALEGKDATVDVKADTSGAESRLDAVLRRVRDLDDEDAEVILRAEASRAEAEVRRLTKLLGSVDGEDAVVVLTARDQATDDLRRVQSELNAIDGRTATAVVDVRTSGLDKLQALAGNLPGIGSALGALGGAGAAAGPAAVGTAFAAAAVGAYQLAQSTAEAALNVDTLAKLTGATVEETGQLVTLWQTTGADTKDLADVIGQVNGVLATNVDLAKELGITLEGASPQEVFLQANEAMLQVEDSQKRLVIGQQLFGEEGVRQVGALNAIYSDLSEAIADTPPPFSAEDARNAREFQTSTTRLKQELGKLGREVGNEVVPAVADLAALLVRAAEGADDLADSIPGLDGLGDAISLPLRPMTNFIDGVDTAADSTLSWDQRLRGAAQAANVYLGPLGLLTNGLFDVKDAYEEAQTSLATNLNPVSMADLQEEAREAADAIGTIEDQWNRVRSLFDARLAGLDLADQFDTLGQKAEDAWIKTAEGADDAEQAQRDYQREILNTQNEVATYAEQVLQLPPEAITDILADIEEGSVADAEATLAALTEQKSVGLYVEMHIQEYVDWANSLNHPVTTSVTVRRPRAASSSATAPTGRTPRRATRGLGAPAPAPMATQTATLSVGAPAPVMAGAAVQNVTNIVNLPVGYDESRVVGALAKWARRNGSLLNAGARGT